MYPRIFHLKNKTKRLRARLYAEDKTKSEVDRIGVRIYKLFCVLLDYSRSTQRISCINETPEIQFLIFLEAASFLFTIRTILINYFWKSRSQFSHTGPIVPLYSIYFSFLQLFLTTKIAAIKCCRRSTVIG